MAKSKLAPIKKRGKFVVLYGPNNVGKSTQTRKLIFKLTELKKDVLFVKYPIYTLRPTGPKINKILRSEQNNPKKFVSEKDLQKLFAQNRKDFQPTVIELLNAGVNVIAEDYKGTGISWGMTRDVDLKYLEKINKQLVDPDISVLLDGERFKEAAESVHRNEGVNSDKWQRARQKHLFLPENTWERNHEMHLFLAERYGWKIVVTKGNVDNTYEKIWKIVKKIIVGT